VCERDVFIISWLILRIMGCLHGTKKQIENCSKEIIFETEKVSPKKKTFKAGQAGKNSSLPLL